jgi:hypothetical protein
VRHTQSEEANVAMRLFCDQCGTEFGATTLRADSKFCSLCGKALSEYVKRQCHNLFKSTPKVGRVDTKTLTGRESNSKKRKSGDMTKDDQNESSSDEPRKSSKTSAKPRGASSKTARRRTRKERGQKDAENDGGDSNDDESSAEENQESEETDLLVFSPCPLFSHD